MSEALEIRCEGCGQWAIVPADYLALGHGCGWTTVVATAIKRPRAGAISDAALKPELTQAEKALANAYGLWGMPKADVTPWAEAIKASLARPPFADVNREPVQRLADVKLPCVRCGGTCPGECEVYEHRLNAAFVMATVLQSEHDAVKARLAAETQRANALADRCGQLEHERDLARREANDAIADAERLRRQLGKVRR